MHHDYGWACGAQKKNQPVAVKNTPIKGAFQFSASWRRFREKSQRAVALIEVLNAPLCCLPGGTTQWSLADSWISRRHEGESGGDRKERERTRHKTQDPACHRR